MLFSQVSLGDKIIVHYRNKAVSGNNKKSLKIAFKLHGLLLFPLNIYIFIHLAEFWEDCLKKVTHRVQQIQITLPELL